MVEHLKDSSIKLKRVFVEPKLPEGLAPLREMSNNLWWSWNKDASDLFRYVNPERWESLNYNPIAVLDDLSFNRAQELVAEKDFMQKLSDVYANFQAYMAEKPAEGAPQIAYFSMEYGLHISVRLYSGGLGVLAGDYLKEASDQNVNLCAVGLLYRYGYFQQSISLNGDQINNYPPQEYTKLPMAPVRDANGEWLKVSVSLPGREVWAKVWRLNVGRIGLYLLDTDINENSWEDRSLTHHLYGGNNEHRLKQEILLGIGGTRALQAMKVNADIYHCNEGHAAFMSLERLKNFIQEDRMTFDEAVEVQRATSLFTTHTPVPAGHDYFPEDLLKTYMYNYTHELGINWEQFVGLGRIDTHNHQELFSMSHLAIRLCQEVNGVSKLHGEVSQKMFKVLYPGYNHKELHIGYVTNGVHYPTWIASEWHNIIETDANPNFIHEQSDPAQWDAVNQLPDEKVVEIRQGLRVKLLDYIRDKVKTDLTRRGESPSSIFRILDGIREDALVVGFARRFATYKRAHLLFRNLERLSELVNHPEHPVMFVFAGKAHPADNPGQQLIKDIMHISKRPEFAGKVIFLEGYNMEMAKLLVRGVDIWLNTPTRPLEASGTSGMKAAMNGVMNMSVLDGWWAEGYREDSGWALPLEKTYHDQALQDELDAETLYNIFENQIVPTFFEGDTNKMSSAWVQYVKNIITKVGPQFTMKRMIDDYFDRFYGKLAKRGRILRADNYKVAKEMADWKHRLQHKWEAIHVVDKEIFDTENFSLTVGEPFKARIKVNLEGVPVENVGLEAVFFKRIDDDRLDLKYTSPMEVVSEDGDIATFESDIDLHMTGVYEYGFRLFPKHELLPHKQDLLLVKWL